MRSRGVLFYPGMRQQEVNLQQGMNFDVRGGSVILMSRSASTATKEMGVILGIAVLLDAGSSGSY